ncbi:MAG: YbgC/YbaW family acyl-CoA thioester hydrolase [Verrucomicrobiales bacterium]
MHRVTAPFSIFESELIVRPDDIDMNGHVHNPKYLDYVLAARYEQMERCYKMAMSEFLERGLNWFVKTAHIQHKRPLFLGEAILVRTQVADIARREVKVNFEIVRKETGKLSADGYCEYSMVDKLTGRAQSIPDDIIEMYSI